MKWQYNALLIAAVLLAFFVFSKEKKPVKTRAIKETAKKVCPKIARLDAEGNIIPCETNI